MYRPRFFIKPKLVCINGISCQKKYSDFFGNSLNIINFSLHLSLKLPLMSYSLFHCRRLPCGVLKAFLLLISCFFVDFSFLVAIVFLCSNTFLFFLRYFCLDGTTFLLHINNRLICPVNLRKSGFYCGFNFSSAVMAFLADRIFCCRGAILACSRAKS